MKKLFVIALSCLLILTTLTPVATATAPSYNLTMQDSLTIEIEDSIPAGYEHLLLTSDDASGGEMMGSGWDESGLTTITIPFTVSEAGIYNVEFVESRGISGEGFSRIDGSIYAEDNATLVHGFNMNFYAQKDPDFVEKEYQVTTSTGWTGGFGNTMIKQKYTNLALEEGTYNIRFDIHMVGSHTNFALDYFKFTPVNFTPVIETVAATGSTCIEFEDHVPVGKEAYVITSADASGGKMVGSGWGGTDFTNITISANIEESGYYDIEFVESMVDRWGSYSRIDGKLVYADGETVAFNNNAGPQLDPDFESKIYENFPENYMEKQKYSSVWLEAGEVNISFDLTLVGGTHTHFALDYIKFTYEGQKVSATEPTCIEFEEYVPADKTTNYVAASPEASGGKMVRSEWGEATFTNFTIPVIIEATGYYNIEFVESKFIAGDGYSRIDGCIKDENNENVLFGFNNNAYPQLDAEFGEKLYTGYSNKMIKQKFTQVYLEAGKVNISFDIGLVGDHTNFALDYIKFSTPDEVTVAGDNVTVSIIPNTSLTGRVILAFYDGNKLSYVKEYNIIDYNRFDVTLPVTAEFDKVKVFVWEFMGSLNPRTPAREFNVTNKTM